jgi:hypothetical protein
VDAFFACHPGMRSQTGAIMSLGKGAAYATSILQKLNTRSLTEAELVEVNNVLPQILWTRNFMISQGFETHENTLLQDNRSATLLESNGPGSSSKQTRCINTRYFFVKGEVKIEHCSNNKTVANFFTKPLQGTLFNQCRNIIMNIKDAASPKLHRSVLGETKPLDNKDTGFGTKVKPVGNL